MTDTPNTETGARWLKVCALPFAVQVRLAFIEHMLIAAGSINRSDIVDAFGVSVLQASNDMALFRRLFSKSMYYNAREKSYLPRPNIKAFFPKSHRDAAYVVAEAFGDVTQANFKIWDTQEAETDQ